MPQRRAARRTARRLHSSGHPAASWYALPFPKPEPGRIGVRAARRPTSVPRRPRCARRSPTREIILGISGITVRRRSQAFFDSIDPLQTKMPNQDVEKKQPQVGACGLVSTLFWLSPLLYTDSSPSRSVAITALVISEASFFFCGSDFPGHSFTMTWGILCPPLGTGFITPSEARRQLRRSPRDIQQTG
jgi:hypothetical protein